MKPCELDLVPCLLHAGVLTDDSGRFVLGLARLLKRSGIPVHLVSFEPDPDSLPDVDFIREADGTSRNGFDRRSALVAGRPIAPAGSIRGSLTVHVMPSSLRPLLVSPHSSVPTALTIERTSTSITELTDWIAEMARAVKAIVSPSFINTLVAIDPFPMAAVCRHIDLISYATCLVQPRAEIILGRASLIDLIEGGLNRSGLVADFTPALDGSSVSRIRTAYPLPDDRTMTIKVPGNPGTITNEDLVFMRTDPWGQVTEKLLMVVHQAHLKTRTLVPAEA